RAFAQLNIQVSALSAMIDRLTTGVIVLDERGVALHANRAARALAARRDGLTLDQHGVPHATACEADRCLEALRRNAAAGGAGGTVRLPRDGEGRPYAALVAPLPAGTGIDGALPERSVLVLIHDPDAETRDAQELVARVFGLP